MLFCSSRWFERRKHDLRTAKFCNLHLEGLFWVRVCSLSLPSTRSLFHLKNHFKLQNIAVIDLRTKFRLVIWACFYAQIASKTLKTRF